ncbi:MAG: polysaccharide deacetylase [Curvibacter sp. PD_MW3]|nr:MAG: polysaccharide deacetylase [Curvibacter sp. PD_MW3]
MNIPILMYHQIDVPPARGTPLRGLVVAPGSFARQMGLLRLLGYQGLSMRDLEPYLKREKKGKVVGITFDDGYQNNVRNALPILKRFGFTATCYGVSSMIGGTNSWDHGIVAEKPLMTLEDWLAWRDAGMDIGSHTRTHADLSRLGPDEAREQIAGSKKELEDRLGCEVRHFCYPYGRFGDEHRTMVRQAGYLTATTTRRGRVIPGEDPMALKRVLVARATHLLHFALKLTTAYEDRRG